MLCLALALGVLILLVSAPTHFQNNIDPDLQASLEKLMELLFPVANTTAMGLSVIMDDEELVYSKGYGFANSAKGEPVLNSTQFLIGSVTKSFTAVLAVKVLTKKFPNLGESVLDIPIRKLIPEVDFMLIDRYRTEHASFRDMLSHTLCLIANNLHILSGQLSSTEELFYRARYNPQICPFRSPRDLLFGYNNQIYGMIEVLIEAVAGISYTELMQELWNDLGMSSTEFVKASDDYDKISGRALPYFMKDGNFYPYNTKMISRLQVSLSSGGIISTLVDMTRFMSFVMNEGTINGVQVVPKEVFMWLTRPTANTGMGKHEFKRSFDDFVYGPISYGMGFEIASLDGWEVVRVSGNARPYFSAVVTIPALKLGVFTATNTGPTVIFPHYAVAVFIYEWMKGNREGAQEVAIKFAKRKQMEEHDQRNEIIERLLEEQQIILQRAHIEADNLTKIVGKYGSGSLGDIEISERLNNEKNKTQYFVQYGPWYQGWLENAEGLKGVYKISWVTDIFQEEYTFGLPPGVVLRNMLVVIGDTLFFIGQLGAIWVFERGVSLETLPRVPWDPNSC